MHDRGRPIPEGLVGEVRRTVAGARLHIDHRHEEIEFDLVVRGVGSYTIGNLTYDLKPGTLLWLGTGQQHRLVRSPKLEMWVVYLRPHLLAPAELAEIRAQPSRLLPGEELVDLDGLLSQVAQDSDEPETYNAGLSYAFRRALRASRACPPAHLKLMHPAVTRALMLLRESGASFSLSRLAEESGIAASYLSRLLVEHTNRSFVDWRNRIRLERFFEDYRPGANLLQASLDAGFGSYARFHHVFTEMVGCTPSEWTHRADTHFSLAPDDPAGATGSGVPPAPNLSNRQRWTRLAPLAGPVLLEFFGADFLKRLLAAEPVAHRAGEAESLPASLSPADIERFLGALKPGDAERAAELRELLHTHDFAGLFAGVLRVYDLAPGDFADAVTAFVVLLWTALSGAPDPSFEQVHALRRQVAGVLWRGPSRDPGRDREIHTALLCHFVVIYHALQAARASGDGRALSQLRAITLSLGQTLLGEEIAQAMLTSHGLRRAP